MNLQSASTGELIVLLWSDSRCQCSGDPFPQVLPRFILAMSLSIGRSNTKGNIMMRKFLTLSTMMAIAASALVVPTVSASARDHQYREWRGKDGRTYCRKSDGTVGLVVGAAGGALVGRAIDTRGERATGTILGAAAGALIGREVASKRRCR